MIMPFGSPLSPSAICLGTGSFGSSLPEDRSFAVMDAYAEGGGNFLDTAHIYAAWLENGVGASERTVGAWVKARGMRDRVIIGTKGGHPPLDAMDRGRLGAADLNRDLNESLDRLGMDCVDIYWLHRDDPGCDLDELLETLNGFMADGRIRAFGASNWSVERIAEANARAGANGLKGFTANQPGWSLANRNPDAPQLPGMLSVDGPTRAWHGETQMPLVAYTSQACGYFSADNVAWAQAGHEGPCPHGADFDCPTSRARLRVAAEIGKNKGYLASQVALAYLLHQPFPVYPIIGTGNPGRVQAAMTARVIALSDQELEQLEAAEYGTNTDWHGRLGWLLFAFVRGRTRSELMSHASTSQVYGRSQLSSSVGIPRRWQVSPHDSRRQESPHTEKLLMAALNKENWRGSDKGMRVAL